MGFAILDDYALNRRGLAAILQAREEPAPIGLAAPPRERVPLARIAFRKDARACCHPLPDRSAG
jgi:hypothetical protein